MDKTEEKKQKVLIYNQNYYLSHKDDKKVCEICGGKYKIFNKNHHINTKKHIKKAGDQTMEGLTKMLIENAQKAGLKIEIKDNTLTIVENKENNLVPENT
jgi:hydrogenase maturation factor